MTEQQIDFAGLNLDWEKVTHEIVSFLRQQLDEHGRSGLCLGLSGGIDSALVAALSVRALEDPMRVRALHLPDRDSEPECTRRAIGIAELLGVSLETRDISAQVEARGGYQSALVRWLRISPRLNRMAVSLARNLKPRLHDSGSVNAVWAGFNVRHRLRRELLERFAEENDLLPVGAANRTEVFTGWFVQDGIDDLPIEPIIMLYKAQVRVLAAHLGLPRDVVEAPATHDMLRGVRDEHIMGFSQAELDRVAYAVEHDEPQEQVLRDGISREVFDGILSLHRRTEGKRVNEHVYPTFE